MLQSKNSLSMGWEIENSLAGVGVDNAAPVPELLGFPI
jgi:hypothetical protein